MVGEELLQNNQKTIGLGFILQYIYAHICTLYVLYDCSISLLLHAPYAKYAYISKYMRYLAEMLPIRRTTKQAIRTIFSCPISFKTFW